MFKKLPFLLIGFIFLSFSCYASNWKDIHFLTLKNFNKEIIKVGEDQKSKNKRAFQKGTGKKGETLEKGKTFFIPVSQNTKLSIESTKHGRIGFSTKFTF